MPGLSFKSIVAAMVVFTAPAFAAPVPFLPGTEVQDGGLYDDFQVGFADPDWSGTVLDSGVATATKVRDGFVTGVGVVPGLYDVTATVSSKVVRATNGQLVFSYDFSALDLSGTGTNGVLGFDLTGFSGYDVTFAFQKADAFFYAPQINRSADGDTISFDFFDPTDLLGAGFETFLFAVDAPDYRANGAGTAAILLDTFGTENVALTGFLPVPAQVPLPASLPALLLGLGALGALRTRNRRAGGPASLDSAAPRA